MLTRVTASVLAAAWMGVIFAFSSLPAEAVPGRFGPLAHFLEYALLGTLVYVAARTNARDWRAVAFAILIAAAYAATDEIHQAFVPGRMPDIADWGLDVLGANVGALLALRLDSRKAA